MTAEALIDLPFDLERLAEWMDRQGLERGPITDTKMLTGGTQNILLAFSRGNRRFVLRRPPAKPRPGNDETMRREMRVLGALAGSAVPHPGLIAGCPESDVLGAAFYLMEPVEGFNATNGLPELHASDPAIRRQMGFALIDGIASLARVDYSAAGLDGFGKTEHYLQRQPGRWLKQLEGYAALDGWPGSKSLPGVDRIVAYLNANMPADFRPGVMHGDSHIGNVMYRYDGPALAAIIDWELATIGDPLIDLAWILATWRNSDGPNLPVLIVEPWDGFPTAEELVAHYGRQVDRDLGSIDWYVVLACFKLAVLLEGTFARACAGKAPEATGRQLHDTAVAAMQRALLRIN